jgi:hypothetical protein
MRGRSASNNRNLSIDDFDSQRETTTKAATGMARTAMSGFPFSPKNERHESAETPKINRNKIGVFKSDYRNSLNHHNKHEVASHFQTYNNFNQQEGKGKWESSPFKKNFEKFNYSNERIIPSGANP